MTLDPSGALEELRSGALGDAFADLLYRVTSAVARFGPFPPPSHGEHWTPEDVEEAAHNFLSDEHTPRRLATLALTASNEASLRRLLEAAVRNYLRDEARGTDRAHLIQRLRDICEADDSFTVGSTTDVRTWALAGNPTAVAAVSLQQLVDSAFKIGGVLQVRWAGRRGPIATREDLVRLLRAVLAEANGAVPEATLVDVIVRRLGLSPDASTVPLDDIPGRAVLAIEAGGPTPEVAETASDIWAQLTDRERLTLAAFDMPVRELATILGIRKSAAATARSALVRMLTMQLGTRDDGQEVFEALRSAAELLLARTSQADSASEQS